VGRRRNAFHLTVRVGILHRARSRDRGEGLSSEISDLPLRVIPTTIEAPRKTFHAQERGLDAFYLIRPE
jgi:hypothetical protein